jgi:hypothetical protein
MPGKGKTFLGALVKLQKATISFVIPSSLLRLPACNNPASTGRIFIKFNIAEFFENM